MPVVFRFESLDYRNRATLIMPDVDTAITHYRENFADGGFTVDEDGEIPASPDELRHALVGLGSIRLYDQLAWHSGDTVDIICASA